MCIAITKPAGVELFKTTLQRSFESNSDGAGFAYEEDGKVIIEKGFFTFEDFLSAYTPHGNKQCLVHFRIRTHGKLDKDMCHPFEINDHLAMIHNGIINDHGTNETSDTHEFIEELIKPMIVSYGDQILSDPAFKKIIEKYVGASKLMFLNGETKEFIIYNRQMCHQNSGCIFSNYSYVTPQYEYLPKTRENQKGQGEIFDGRDPPPSPERETRKFKNHSWERVEVPTLGTFHGPKFSSNDFIRLSEDGIGYKKGDVCWVDKIWNDYKLDAFNCTQDKDLKDIPLWHCELADAADVDWEDSRQPPETKLIVGMV